MKFCRNGSFIIPLISYWDVPFPLSLVQEKSGENGSDIATTYQKPQEVFGVIGEYVRLRCETSKPGYPLEWRYKSKVLESSRDFKIYNNGNGNWSELRVYLKSKTRFKNYTCQLRINESKVELVQKFNLLEGRKPPKFKLVSEWVEMRSAKFRTELDPDDKAEDHFLIGHVVFYKRVCHNAGPWMEANVTENPNGFTITDLRPNESYCLKVALRNKATVGSFDEYWSIHTSSACVLKSRDFRPVPTFFLIVSALNFISYIQ